MSSIRRYFCAMFSMKTAVSAHRVFPHSLFFFERVTLPSAPYPPSSLPPSAPCPSHSTDEPDAKASMVWIIGEYADRIDNANELLEQVRCAQMIESFSRAVSPHFVSSSCFAVSISFLFACTHRVFARLNRPVLTPVFFFSISRWPPFLLSRRTSRLRCARPVHRELLEREHAGAAAAADRDGQILPQEAGLGQGSRHQGASPGVVWVCLGSIAATKSIFCSNIHSRKT